MSPAQVKNEDGFSLVELIVAMGIGIIVLFGVLAVVQASTTSSSRTTARVTANQAARPTLTRIVDELHSSCIYPDLAPIQANSDGNSVTFIHSTDRGVNPVPTKRMISWNPTTGIIDETIYTQSGGVAPAWTFNSTGTTTRFLINVSQALLGNPEAAVPVFQYYAYDIPTATVSTSALQTPLSAANAAKVVKVTVSFQVTPNRTTVSPDPDAALSVSDSVLLRFSPATTASGEALLPCG